MGRLKIKPVVTAATFRHERQSLNRCHDNRLCPQHAWLAKFREDNERLGVPYLHAWYETHAIPCGPMRRVEGIKGRRSREFA